MFVIDITFRQSITFQIEKLLKFELLAGKWKLKIIP